jgi:cellulose biosynthesis protein BcsQ
MTNMQTVMVYSEAGGVSKTTAAVSLAMTAAENGRRVVLIDLDPRAATTKWTRAEPVGEGLHVGAILGASEEPIGWAEELAAASRWHERLRIIPAARGLSNREADRDDFAELRLKASLEGLNADLVVIDCANRQGGPLTLSALHASDTVLYAATASDSGVDGVTGAQRTIEAFKRSRERMGAPSNLTEAGVSVTRDGTGFMSYAESDAIDQIKALAPILEPIVPHLSIVPEVRLAGEWYGMYRKGNAVRDAYTEVMRKVIR